jgi:IS30 family transposase
MEYPQQAEMQVSPETIYGYLYQEIKEEPELKGHFRHPRVERKARGGTKDLGGQIPGQKLLIRRSGWETGREIRWKERERRRISRRLLIKPRNY